MKSIERLEEQKHQDLDGDGEQGESPAHRRKVLGTTTHKKKESPSMATSKKNPFVPASAGKKTIPPFLKTGSDATPSTTTPSTKKALPRKGKKMCSSCLTTNASSCSH